MSARWFDDFGQDVRYAWRSLMGSPVFTTVAVIALALGIGATTAIFSVVYGVLLKPLPYVDADRVVHVRVTAPASSTAASAAPAAKGPPVSASLGSVTVAELIELRTRIKGLSHVAFRGGPSFVTMSGVGEARRLQGMQVAPGAFDVLGVKPLLGRGFGASEEAPAAEPVMLLAHDTWQREFNGDSTVVGRTVMLANALGGPATPTTHTIVGVMPRGFEFPDAQMQLKLTSVEPGYRAANVLTFQVALPATRYPPDRVRTFTEDLTERLRTAPGVEAAAYAQQLPLVGLNENALFRRTPERPARFVPGSPELRLVSRDYLSVMGTRIVHGRGLAEGDAAGRPRVLLINETTARRELPNQNPIGLHVYIGNDAGLWEIVGVVEDVRQYAFDREPTPQVFVDIRQWPGPVFPIGPYFSMRPQAGVAAALAAVHQLDPEAGLFNVAPMADIVANSTSRPRLYAALVGLFAAIAAALAAIGFYGVIAYGVAQRRREIGIRVALGATRAQVIGLVLRQTLLLTAVGILIGVAGAATLRRHLESMLFGLTPLDPTTWGGVSVLFAMVAAVAAYVPARRAMTIDPVRALRAE